MREGRVWAQFAAASGLASGLSTEIGTAQAKTVNHKSTITSETPARSSTPDNYPLQHHPAPEKTSPPAQAISIPDTLTPTPEKILDAEASRKVRIGYNLHPLACLPFAGFRTMGGLFNNDGDTYTFERLLAQQGIRCTGGPLDLSTVFQYGHTTFNYTASDETAARLSFREKTLLFRAGINLPHLRWASGHELHFTFYANWEQPMGKIFPGIDSALYQGTDFTTYTQTPGSGGQKFQESLNFHIEKFGLTTKLQFPSRKYHRFELELELLYQNIYLNLQTTILDMQTAANLNLLKVDADRLSVTKNIEAMEIGLGGSYTYKQVQFLFRLGIFGDASNGSHLYDGHFQVVWRPSVARKK